MPITAVLYGKRKQDKLTPAERLAEHIAARAPRRALGGFSVGGGLRGQLGNREYGALLDALGRKTRKPQRRGSR
jgi:hypothetical protein